MSSSCRSIPGRALADLCFEDGWTSSAASWCWQGAGLEDWCCIRWTSEGRMQLSIGLVLAALDLPARNFSQRSSRKMSDEVGNRRHWRHSRRCRQAQLEQGGAAIEGALQPRKGRVHDSETKRWITTFSLGKRERLPSLLMPLPM